MEFKEKLDKLTKLNRERSDQLERNKKIWIKDVNNLHKNIKKWFDEHIQKGHIVIDYEQLQYIAPNVINLLQLRLFLPKNQKKW